LSSVLGAALLGVDGVAIEVEVRISSQLPRTDIVGLADAAVRESYMFDILRFFDAIPAPILSNLVAQLNSGTVTLSWTAIPARRYRVQYKSNLDDIAWFNLGSAVTASDHTASKTDTTVAGVSQRFYRVLLIE